jgi:hypothetical protein
VFPFARAELGPDLQMVCLSMALQDQMERVKKRHAGDEAKVDLMKVTVDTMHCNVTFTIIPSWCMTSASRLGRMSTIRRK